MANMSGVVQEVKSYNTAYGTMYSLVINGEQFGVGKYPPKAKAGDNVTFDFTEKGRYKNVETKSLKVTGSGPVPTPAAAPSPAPRGASDFGKNQDAISKQAARNTAVAFMNMLASQEALPVAKSAKPGDKYEALRGILERLTGEFYDYSMGRSSTPLTDAAEPASSDFIPEDTPWDR